MGELNEGEWVRVGNSASRNVNGLIGQMDFQTGWSGCSGEWTPWICKWVMESMSLLCCMSTSNW